MAPMVAEALAWVDQQLPINNRKLIIRVTFEFKWTCFVSPKLPIDNVILCRPSPGVLFHEIKLVQIGTRVWYKARNHDFVKY